MLDGDDPQTVNRLFIYLYTNDYPEGAIQSGQQPERTFPPTHPPSTRYESSRLPHLRRSIPSKTAMQTDRIPSKTAMPTASTPSTSQLMNNVLVYAIASKYDLPGLKALAKARVQSLAKTPSAYTETTDLAQVARIAFESTPAGESGLRDIIVDICSRNIDQILDDSAMTDTIRDIGSLSFGIMLRARDSHKVALERANSNEAIVQMDLARSKAETSRTAEQMSRIVTELKSAIATKRMANVELEDAISQRGSAVAQQKQLRVESSVANTRLSEAISAQKLALSQKDFAINQRNKIIAERDAALNQKCNCLNRLDYFLDKVEEWDKCRNVACGADFSLYLERFGPDDSNFNMHLRCSYCNCRHDIGAGVGPRPST